MRFKYARDSLKYLVQLYDIREMHIPYYLCDVVRHSLVEVGCKPLFYHIDDEFLPMREFGKDDFILYPNYFGVCDKNVRKLGNIYPKLIIDNAHSFWSEPSGFACFNSERKFRNVEEGSYLWIKEKEADNEYQLPDYENEMMRRNEFNNLHKRFIDFNLLNIDVDAKSPLCYPLLAKTELEADELVKMLVEEGKLIYRYWNPLPQSFNEYKFYSRLVPIPLN